jgi:hypothetical protein
MKRWIKKWSLLLLLLKDERGPELKEIINKMNKKKRKRP